MSLSDRLDGFQRRHSSVSLPLSVLYKFFDDQGVYLAALITYYGFVSLLPLLLLLSTVLSFVFHNDPHLQAQVLGSTARQFPVIGAQFADPKAINGSVVAVVAGVLGTVYGGLGVAQASQNAMNVAWMVPRNSRPNPLRARGRSLLLLSVVGLAVISTTVLSALGSAADAFGLRYGLGFKLLLVAVSVVVNTGVFILGFTVATARPVTVRQVAPGAVSAAVCWQILQLVGPVYVRAVIHHASAINGVFALMLGLIGWIYLEALTVVLSVELNVVRALRLYPRSLLTPFTDDVVLTRADQAAYRSQARAQRAKGFEQITVTFDPAAGTGPAPRAPGDDPAG